VPTYQYACTECDEQLEVVQKFTDDPLSECPVCHGRLRKVFSPVGVLFKGSGFYRTDNRSSRTKEKAAAGASSSSSSDSNSSGSSSNSSRSSRSSSESSGSSGSSSSPVGATKSESAA